MPEAASGRLAATEVSLSFAGQLVLDRVSLVARPGARIGVVSPNGCGKTTLLRVLAGLEQPDSGSVSLAPPTLSALYLPQEREVADEVLAGFLARRAGVTAAERELERAAKRLTEGPSASPAYEAALQRLLSLAGDDFDLRLRAAAVQAGLPPDLLERPLPTLSGGQRARAGVASLLLARADVLLLDEPTNDLDEDGLRLLERFLAESPSAIIVVSHDRAFLDRRVTAMLVFEEGSRQPRLFPGGFSAYEAERRRLRTSQAAAFAAYEQDRGRLTSQLQQAHTRARAGGHQASTRGTHALERGVRAAGRRLERLRRPEKPWEPWQLRLGFSGSQRGGDVVVRLERAVIARGDFRLGPLDVDLHFGDRLLVRGANGSGKTSLLQALAGELSLSSGRRFAGPGAVIGRLRQERDAFASAERLLDAFARRSELDSETTRTLLAKFGLGADDVLRPVASLTPGERTRAQLALLAATGVNALLLDEPTNHLDLPAIEELEGALERFDGTLVLVSHDAWLVGSFRATHVLAL
ncbi:MAG: ABC-F family ATP-binding cassette domain-containing protein [Gaiellaceae bacterium]